MRSTTPAETSPRPGAPDDRGVQLPWESVDADDAEGRAPGAAGATESPATDELPGEPGGPAPEIPDDSAEAEDLAEAEAEAEAVNYESPVPAEPLVDELGPAPRGGGWTLALLCAGIALIACTVLIPQADANRRMVYEREKLKLDLESIRKQVATNDDFLKRVADDPNLAERLAQRQMKIIREGTRVLELKKQKQQSPRPGAPGAPATAGFTADEMSPFHLVHVAPPPPLPPYKPVGGLLAGLCYNPHTRLYLTGIGLFLMAAGLVFGFGPKPLD